MTKTLNLLFHPDFGRSKANAALAAATARMGGVETIDMYALYPDGIEMNRDGEAEVARLLQADRIILQFPVQWYSTPPLLKAWQDVVLTRMFYVAYEAEGRHLEGTPLKIIATAGNMRAAYGPSGRNMFSMTELFAPLRATAHRCGLTWSEPFILYEANTRSREELDVTAAAYIDTLQCWIAATPAKEAA
jgi:putative NADPH-quinone reductase